MMERKRMLGLAGVSAGIGLIIAVWFLRTAPFGAAARFNLHPTGRAGQGVIAVPPLVVPVGLSLTLLALVCLAVAALYAAGRFKGHGGLAVAALSAIAAFLVWATAGKSLSLIGMLQGSLAAAIPIVLAALSGVMCERSGVINIAIEGMMLSAAFTSVVVGSVTGSLFIGIAAGVLTGLLLALVHAHLAIAYRVDQIVSGTVINIFSIGMTSYLSSRFLQQSAWLNNAGTVGQVSIPGLAKLPVVGPLFFSGNLYLYLTLGLVVLLHVALFKTRFGLRTRAVGEHPRAADTLGIPVHQIRYLSVAIGGALAGLGGTYFTLGSVGRFDEVMTAGKGFIGLAAMIFGKWTPFGSLAASTLFGFADSLQAKLQILFIPIPSEFLLMAPYLATIIIVSGLVGRAVPPAADGQPYER